MKLVRFASKEPLTAFTRRPHIGAMIGKAVVDLEEIAPNGDMRAFLETEKAFESAEDYMKKKSRHPTPLGDVTLLAPIANPSAIFCVGMNYVDHCKEQNFPIPDEPIIFSKLPRCVINPGDPIELNPIIKQLDFEVELAIVIGKKGRFISEKEAPSYIAGYTVAHDVSARHWQLKRNGGQWFMGKTFDTFAPIGPCIASGGSLDPNKLGIRCVLNGEVVQNSCTSEFIFNPAQCVAWISSMVTLHPGDLIFTGTPPGVGCFRKPPLWLKAGDVVKCEIDGIGSITNPVKKIEDPRKHPSESVLGKL